MTWRMVAVAVYIALNLVAIRFSIGFGPSVDDWQLWSSLADRLARGDVYAPEDGPPFVWSPVAAWIMAGVAAVGYVPWVLAHFVAVFLLRPPLLILLTAFSWAFWWDAASAHIMIFILVTGVLALRGSRLAALGYLILLLLMPRPVQMPLALWLLWKMPAIRWPFTVLFAAHAIVVVASGYALPWAIAAISWTDAAGIGPSRYLGTAWLIVGVPLGAWLLWRGRVGWSGLAISPYLLPEYLLMPLVDLRVSRHRGHTWWSR